MRSKLLFLTLKIFSETGGIEKVCRVAGKSMYELAIESGSSLNIFSMHDAAESESDKYFPSAIYSAFNGRKFQFVFNSIKAGIKSGVVIFSHVNLLSVGFLIKLFSPKTKVLMFAHGIEIWKELPSWKIKMLHRLDYILSVSHFTKNKIKKLYNLPEEKCFILNNCLDPFLPKINSTQKKSGLQDKYGLKNEDFVIMTLTRLSYKEKNKNYDKVIFAIKELLAEHPHLKYLFVGKYDEQEKARLDAVIKEMNLEGIVVFTGFVPDDELADHYNLADLFIIPSEKEGFGIVFIEAMYYGKSVIAGNRDGSVDALANGELGILVDPQKQEEITGAIKRVIENKTAFIPDRELLLSKFSYSVYKNNLKNILEESKN